MGLTIKVRVWEKKTIVIPKKIAETLGADEGSKLRLKVQGDTIILKSAPNQCDS